MGMFAPLTWSGGPAKWLWATAIFEFVLAVAFVVAGLMVPIVRGGFLLTAGILGATSLGLGLWARSMSRGYANAQRLKVQGVPGQARILGMRQTGVSLNQQPQVELRLEVETEMHGTYPVAVKEFVPLMMLGTLSTGRLPVKVDPADPNNLVIEWESAMGGAMPMGDAPPRMGGTAMAVMPSTAGITGMPESARVDARERLLETGTPGRARVVSARRTGQTDAEGRPVYDLQLEIHVPGRPVTRGPARVGIPPERIERLEEGDEVPVKVDPYNPASMAVDWDGAS